MKGNIINLQMKKEFLKLAQKINISQTQEELENVIKNWNVQSKDIDAWIDELFDSIHEIDINKMPYVLESLYKENNKIKFIFFCILLENTYSDLPYITNLENINLSKEKYQIFAPTLVKIAQNSYNSVADCMYLILINNDIEGKLLKKEDKEILISGINDKLMQIIEYINECDKVDTSIYMAIEILLEIATHINNKETFELLNKLENLKFNEFNNFVKDKISLIINK